MSDVVVDSWWNSKPFYEINGDELLVFVDGQQSGAGCHSKVKTSGSASIVIVDGSEGYSCSSDTLSIQGFIPKKKKAKTSREPQKAFPWRKSRW